MSGVAAEVIVVDDDEEEEDLDDLVLVIDASEGEEEVVEVRDYVAGNQNKRRQTKSQSNGQSKRKRQNKIKASDLIDLTVVDKEEVKEAEQLSSEPNANVLDSLKTQLKCAICQDEITELSSTKCGHIFCYGCARDCIKALKRCPTCRQRLTLKDVHRLYF